MSPQPEANPPIALSMTYEQWMQVFGVLFDVEEPASLGRLPASMLLAVSGSDGMRDRMSYLRDRADLAALLEASKLGGD